ncbi:phage replisome organizer N-terminal domain-containing protein [Anaerosporobacter faecicola]|uniref:phage replisome organizer N-terminal domain-containing protein n=1 Tax=Anaerosporobacter faecicola TaxID=2718714 RepID=UPI0014394C7B|nr:phage replisome organizer N-terminal domain-containing protein [Anaerosporobacter faecicola]
MADVKWIKVVTDIFDDEKMLLIDAMPCSDTIITIWFKLLCLAGKTNNDGVFLLSDKIAYTDEMLSAVFRREVPDVRMALEKFEQLGMVEIIDNTITIPNWNKYQTLDSYDKKKERDRLYQQERRARQKQLIEEKSSDNRLTTDDSSSCVAVSEEEIEKEKEEDIDKDIKKKTKKLATAQTYFPNDEKLNSTFIEFIKMRKSIKNGKMTERAITMMINKLNKYDNDTAIAMLEKSILNNWKDVYGPDGNVGKQQSNQGIDWSKV